MEVADGGGWRSKFKNLPLAQRTISHTLRVGLYIYSYSTVLDCIPTRLTLRIY